jgi:hypothetical protein
MGNWYEKGREQKNKLSGLGPINKKYPENFFEFLSDF